MRTLLLAPMSNPNQYQDQGSSGIVQNDFSAIRAFSPRGTRSAISARVSRMTANLPNVNPLANLRTTERAGIVNPVRSNISYDVRGEPRALQRSVVTEEPAFLKSGKTTEAYLDAVFLQQYTNRDRL